MNTTPEDEPVLFGDCVHLTQATKLSRGWIKKGQDQYVPTTGSRARVNIAGAINPGVLHEEGVRFSGFSF